MHFKRSIFLHLITLFVLSKRGVSLECLVCEWNANDPLNDEACFEANADFYVQECPANTTDSGPSYCLSEFIFDDDIISKVIRSCSTTNTDKDDSTKNVPTVEKCVTDFDMNLTASTCYLACETYACNNQGAANLTLCPYDCGNFGRCNFVTGQCLCNDGWTGEQCNKGRYDGSPVHRHCIQCDSETNKNCANYTTSSPCPDRKYQYCSVVSVTRYNEDGATVRQFLTRSCTESFEVADECFISIDSATVADEVEYTCVSTCDVDGCNFGIPDGIGEEVSEASGVDEIQPISCVVCDSDEDVYCAKQTATEVCHSAATHCISTVTYYLSEKTDLHYEAEPEYELERVVRDCATEAVDKNCTEVMIGRSTLKKVTCTETCQEDGCNTGWPARPKCSQCSCSKCIYNDECLSSPPMPTDCSLPYHEFCTIQDVDRYNVIGDSRNFGFPRLMTRNCSYRSIGNDDCTVSQYGTSFQSCNKSCTEDGCNLGYYPYTGVSIRGTSGVSAIQSNHLVLTLLLIVIAALMS